MPVIVDLEDRVPPGPFAVADQGSGRCGPWNGHRRRSTACMRVCAAPLSLARTVVESLPCGWPCTRCAAKRAFREELEYNLLHGFHQEPASADRLHGQPKPLARPNGMRFQNSWTGSGNGATSPARWVTTAAMTPRTMPRTCGPGRRVALHVARKKHLGPSMSHNAPRRLCGQPAPTQAGG